MTEPAIESLEGLLRALGRERSLRGRLRVLGHSWTLLRSLSPAERERVAMRVGSSWAWKRLEKSFLRDGALDEKEELVGSVLQRLGRADPKELRKLATLVRNRDREGAQDLLLMTLQEALEEEAAQGERDELRKAVKGESAAPEPPKPESEPGAAEPEPAESEPPPEAKLVHTAAEVLASTMARPVEPPSAEPAPAPAEPAAPAPLPPREEPPPRPASRAAPAPEPPARRAVTPAQPEPTPLVHDGADRLRVLRALHRDAQPGAALGRDGRAHLVDQLGGGWASRRALSRMITARSVDDVGEALELIDRLGRPGQRAWCLADLIEHWPLEPVEVDRILAAAPSDAARRRLERRAAQREAHP